MPDISLKSLPRFSLKYRKTLEKMGIYTVKDFFFHFPFRYDDFRQNIHLSDDFLGKMITTEGKIKKSKLNRIFKKRMTVAEIVLEDENENFLKAVWFNQPYVLDGLLPETKVRLSGKLEKQGKFFFMNSPAWERASRDATNTSRLVPVYPETKGITSKWIRWQMKTLLPMAKNIPDILPEEIRKKYHLPEIYAALCQIHFPDSKSKVVLSQKRFAFESMLLAQLQSLKIKSEWKGKRSIPIKFNESLIKNFVENLPFRLTDAQRKASFEILKDLEKMRPMNRLLNGDVGSGKTIVAAIASLQAISTGHQVAIMAPTEVLARQHFENLNNLFLKYKFKICLLTNSYKLVSSNLKLVNSNSDPNYQLLVTNNFKRVSRNSLLEKIKKREVDLIIGTHALIQKDVLFKNLALVIIDEQHRFGVTQRAALQSENIAINDGNAKNIPHLLTMTATPIPRTLSIAYFGSLDLSLLDEMPKNRKPIITKAVAPGEQEEVYEFIRNEIKKGRQAFIIFPLVTESEKMSEVKAATQEHERLSKNIFPDRSLGLMHGKLKPKEKEEVMNKFKNKEYDILVSTSVVEVGVDVPNATVMVIENAERFGLTQLHQFRGRVGRGENQSYCFLFAGGKKQETSEVGDAVASQTSEVGGVIPGARREQKFLPPMEAPASIPRRLKILEKTTDGFEIAEHDLKLRGPGQFFGTLQSGLPDIAMENLSNIKLIKFAREEALAILKSDPKLKSHPEIREALEKFSKDVHLE